jgi:branched-chain amino acid transport system ATP-binding protein
LIESSPISHEGNESLRVQQVSKRYGGVVAVDQTSLTVPPNRVTGLIGPNGAGKSTMVGIVTGFIRPDSGAIHFGERNVTKLGVAKRNRIGIARTFQQATPLAGLSVLENVLVGMTASYRGGALGVVAPFGDLWLQERQQRDRAYQVLEEFGLADQAESDASELAFGQLRLLEIARAMATKPRILLLDEPAAGLNRVEMSQLSDLILGISKRGVGVLVIDHDVPFVFGMCELITVMDYGRVIATGDPQEIEDNSAVRAAYLGVSNVQGASQN